MSFAAIGKIATKLGKSVTEVGKEATKDVGKKVVSDVGKSTIKNIGKTEVANLPKELTPLKETDRLPKQVSPKTIETLIKDINTKMEPPVIIKFKCPEGCNPSEFLRQLKGQERGLNSQTLAENIANREKYQHRKLDTGSGRAPEGGEAQNLARQKAYQSRIESNQKNGMSYSMAKKEADSWISTQAALHNPDQIAGGDPLKVSRMGDASVNSSIGAQWKSRVSQLDEAIKKYSDGKSLSELINTKMNVKLEME